MKIRIITLGCKLNFAESSALRSTLEERGHTIAKAGEEADLCIVNTCSVTDTAEHKDRQAIHRIKRENPHARIVVTGCYAALRPNEIADMAEVNHVVPKSLTEFQAAYSHNDRTRCFLKVQDGCNYFCTYCTIPFARGRSRNPSISFVVKQAKQALAEGAKEIILTGVNTGDFGRSTGESFIELIQALDNLGTENYRIRISSCEPNLLSNEVIHFVAQSKHFAPHFHIPLQSGSNEVLKIMKRRYTRELFAERVRYIKTLMPDAFIGVDCMAGVRGETEEYFNDYVTFIKELPVSQLHVFTYSERPGTRILDMDLCVVPKTERARRGQVLQEISDSKLKAFYAEHKGKRATVLWESKKQNGLMYGFTENYIKVSCPYDKNKINQFEETVI